MCGIDKGTIDAGNLIAKIKSLIERLEKQEQQICRMVVEEMVNHQILNYIVDVNLRNITGTVNRDDKTLPIEVKIESGLIRVKVAFPFSVERDRLLLVSVYVTNFNNADDEFVMKSANGEITIETVRPVWRGPELYSEAEIWELLDGVITMAEKQYQELNDIAWGDIRHSKIDIKKMKQLLESTWVALTEGGES